MHSLEELERINQLLLCYGELLTPSQKKIMEDYYVYNLSLSEISENHQISRSAVNDCLKKSLQKCEEYEKKLELMKKNSFLKKKIVEWQKKQADAASILADLERMIEDGI